MMMMMRGEEEDDDDHEKSNKGKSNIVVNDVLGAIASSITS